MKNRWVTFLTGRVRVKAEGRGVERLLNRMVQEGIAVWNVKRYRTGVVRMQISLQDIHRLREIVRETDFEGDIVFNGGEGAPFLWKRLKKNSGFLIGLFLFFMLVAFLSNMTWGIEIKGAAPETEHQVRKELKKMGIQVGTSHLLNQDLKEIQKTLTERIDHITWIGVDLKGTTFHFQVVEKTEPKEQKGRSPGHLVADRKAVIAEMFVEKGKPVVKVNQFVRKGQLLVSGIIGDDEDQKRQKTVSAKGEVLGKTWYTTQVEFPLTSKFEVFTGDELRKRYVSVNGMLIPFWGFEKNTFNQFGTETKEYPIKFLGWKMPLAYTEKTIREKEQYERSLSEKQAVEAAKELARHDLLSKISEEAKVEKDILLQEQIENGKVSLTINFQVIENIAKEKPITQGE